MKVGEQAVDHLELEAWTNEERGLPGPGSEPCPPSTAAVSSVRVTVVPTAVIEEPRALAAAIAAAVCSGILNHSLCNSPRSRSSERRFRNVPAPTWSVTVDLHSLAFRSSRRAVVREGSPWARPPHPARPQTPSGIALHRPRSQDG